MEKIKEIVYKQVSKYGMIYLPQSLVGEEVQISFMRKLTKEEKKKLELSNVLRELKELRAKRKKK